jgi:mannose-6-phosphate isomerase-like protein (cupin superfamily)
MNVRVKTSKYIEKTWGYELWFENNEMYCGKLLYVKEGEWSSKGKFHYHKIKDETFIVVEGTLLLDIVRDNGGYDRLVLPPETSFRVRPEVLHRFSSITPPGCKFIEVSTTHSDEDTYYPAKKNV